MKQERFVVSVSTTSTLVRYFIEQYGDLITHLVWRIVQDEEETRDICQETFLRFVATRRRGERIVESASPPWDPAPPIW